MSQRVLNDAIVRALCDPEYLMSLDKQGWTFLLARARKHGLLARLSNLVFERDLVREIPSAAVSKFKAAKVRARRNATDICFEAHCVRQALGEVCGSVVLLKGAAYLFSGLALSHRRMSSDLDIMVPKEVLPRVEEALIASGWKSTDISDYDTLYYRRWMHELPPMAHPDRGMTLDVHHTIVPPTARRQPDTAALFDAAVPLVGTDLKTLCPADMVLHAGVHLFNEEIILGLSDLADLHDLVTEFGRQPSFWDELLARASKHNLERVLYYLLRYTRAVFGTFVPDHARRFTSKAAPPMPLRFLMDRLFLIAFVPPILGSWQPGRAIALWLLYVRSHWLKMPLPLLLRHLTSKAWQRWRFNRRRGSTISPTEVQ